MLVRMSGQVTVGLPGRYAYRVPKKLTTVGTVHSFSTVCGCNTRELHTLAGCFKLARHIHTALQFLLVLTSGGYEVMENPFEEDEMRYNERSVSRCIASPFAALIPTTDYSTPL